MLSRPAFFVLVPLYIYPAPGAWQNLYDGITNHTDVSFKVIINPNSGPGTSAFPDINWQTALAYLNTLSNVVTLGYTHCLYASRTAQEVKADIDTYNGWAGYASADIHIDGIWFDESPSSNDLGQAAYMQNLTDHVQATLVRGTTTILNPGTLPDQSFYDISSVTYINAYENTFNDNGYGESGAFQDIPQDDFPKSSVIIHDYARNETELNSDIIEFVSNNMAGLFITSDSGYTSWSSNWSDFLDDVDCAINQ